MFNDKKRLFLTDPTANSKLTKRRLDEDEASTTKAKETKKTTLTITNVEEDPLDAFMKTINEELKETNARDKLALEQQQSNPSSSGLNKKDKWNSFKRKRGELMDDDDDDLKDREALSAADDLASTMETINSAPHKTAKRLTSISLEDITFQPFEKNFYLEAKELADMTDQEVRDYRNQLELKVMPSKGCPKPIKKWAHCGLNSQLMRVLTDKLQFTTPTPIQAQAIPAIMSGKDVIGIAKTGCGKTLSFLLPMFRHILNQPPLEPGDGPIGIIITPTRELATQICVDANKFKKATKLRVVAIYGGPNISEQIALLKLGAEVVVCTPGRMIEMLTVNGGRVTNLRRCTFVVLDEADRLFDMGFEKQIERIIGPSGLIRSDRQTVMFSATFPKLMEAHARRILTKPIEIQVGDRSVVCKDVTQVVDIVKNEDKFLKLLEILGRHVDAVSRAIIFVDKREKADSLLGDLMQASYPCLVLHGGIDEDDRSSTFSSFKKANGEVKVLVATSLAARGLHVEDCICVVNYDCPNHYEDYVHRCGRTGRAGKKGFAYTFITPDQGQYACDIIKALELTGNPVSEDVRKLWNDFKTEQEALGHKVKSSSGFSGRGFKFDEAEAQLVNEKKKYQKKSLGLQDSDDEEEATDGANNDGGADDALEGLINNVTKRTVTSKESGTSGGQMKNNNKNNGSETDGVQNKAAINNQQQPAEKAPVVNNPKLELAKMLASKLISSTNKGIAKTGLQVAQMDTIQGGTSSHHAQQQPLNASVLSTPNAVLNAKMIADQLHLKLNYNPQINVGQPATQTGSHYQEDPAGEVVGDDDESAAANSAASLLSERHEIEIEINDFPQQARWRVTSKDALARISEYSEAGITVRGKYCPPGEEPTDRKLYLAIEGTSELVVDKARCEVARLIKEEINKINNAPAVSRGGRYKVI